MDIHGRAERIFETEKVSETFRKRVIIIKTEEQYPQEISIEFSQDKTELLNNYREGDLVKISFNLNGRKWVDPSGVEKWFNTLRGWRIEKFSETSSQQKPVPAVQTHTNPQEATQNRNDGEEHDDLPF